MSRFRLFLAWLLMAALPLQGMAAASMLFCGAQDATSIAQANGDHGTRLAVPSTHDHAAHGHVAAVPDAGLLAAGDASPGDQKAQQGHACPICASCCQAIALGGFEAVPQATTPPSAEPPHAFVRVSTRTSSLPDKPPRG